MNDKPKIIVIAGPTASGKTAIGIELAEMFGCEIVSADSVQIYKYLNIGSAKPTAEERRVPHHMIDIREPDEDFSAGDYVREAREAIKKILSKDSVPLVVGGTGLYIRLLLGGVAEIPPGQPKIREKLRRQEAEEKGTLYRRLLEIDPESARSTPQQNLSRIIRVLEVFELTGKRMSDIQKEHSFHDRPYQSLFICLNPDRPVLYERIDMRVDNMIKGGLLEEVADLYRRGYHRDLKSMQSLGYKHVGKILHGELDFSQAVNLMKRDTRRYAKRQFTWFRSEPEVLWIGPDKLKEIRSKVANFLGC